MEVKHNEQMKRKTEDSLAIIKEAVRRYPGIAVACSFGKDSVVVLHLCRRIDPEIKIFSVMTPYKFEQTFAYKDYLVNLWGLDVKTYSSPQLDVHLYKQDVLECCDYYKVEPTKRAIKELGLQAWITGLRATEGRTRLELPVYQEDEGLIKVNPILEWTEQDIWDYHHECDIPAHPLYKEGYRSLGCEPCSNKGGNYEREGRWKGTCKEGGECGIHSYGMRSGKKFERGKGA